MSAVHPSIGKMNNLTMLFHDLRPRAMSLFVFKLQIESLEAPRVSSRDDRL